MFLSNEEKIKNLQTQVHYSFIVSYLAAVAEG